MKRNRPLTLTITIFFLLAILTGIFFFFRMHENMVDFSVNYEAGKRLRWGETLYRVADEHYMFKYLPFAAVIYLPLSYLDPAAAKGVWFLIVASSIIGIFYLSLKLLPAVSIKSWLLVSATFLILGRFFFRELYLGQINAVITILLLFMLRLQCSDKESQSKSHNLYSGLIWGLAILLKPYAVIFFPYFLVKKKWSVLFSGAAFCLIGFFVPALYYGFKGNLIVIQEWANSLSQSTPGLFTSQDNVSLIALFVKWTGKQALSLALAGLIIAILAGSILFLIKTGKYMKHSQVLEGILLMMLIPLISPLGWDYTFLMAAPGVMLLLNYFHYFSRNGKVLLIINYFVITFLFYDLMGEKLYAQFMSWSIITINFIVLVGFLFYLRLKKIA